MYHIYLAQVSFSDIIFVVENLQIYLAQESFGDKKKACFILIWHRNHLGIQTKHKVCISYLAYESFSDTKLVQYTYLEK